MNSPEPLQRFTLEDLCSLTDLPKRTVRYYMQIGLVDRPEGETKGAYYLTRHLDQLVQVKRLAQAGVNLERIKEVLDGAQAPVPARQPEPGDIAVKSHVHIAQGIELTIDPHRSGLTAEEIRKLVKSIVNVIGQSKA
jgi:DNA-binding transcriptional MerR regulator